MKDTYLSHITKQINAVTESCGQVLLFGENIDTGSRLSGLARGLKVNQAGKILNVGNCELTHCGVGLGMMLEGSNAVLFMKQLDFLLLGVDQLVNTFNYVRAYHAPKEIGSFTVFVIVCDQGYQGPQSSFNAVSDIASLANIDVYCLNGKADASYVIHDDFVRSGLRVVCTSQRLFNEDVLDIPVLDRAPSNAIFKYKPGQDVTMICYNFSLSQGLLIVDNLNRLDISVDLFHVNYIKNMDAEMLIESCDQTGKLIVFDDSKSVVKFADMLLCDLVERDIVVSVRSFTRRGCADEDYGVGHDQLQVDFEKIVAFVKND